MKTFIKILIIVIILGLIGYAAYWYFSQREAGTPNPFSDGVSVGDFFPFGNGGTTTDTPSPNTTTPNPVPDTGVPTTPPRLWQISTEPQSGAVAFDASTTPFARFVDKATGNIFESKLTLTGSQRVSNTTIPKVYRTAWGSDGKMLVMQYLANDGETIKSVVATLSHASSSSESNLQEVKTSFLSDGIQSVSAEPQTGALAYLDVDSAGSKVYVSTPKGIKEIYDSVIKDFSVSWVNKNTIALMSKPSSLAAGQLYFLKADNGILSRVMSGPFGLSARANPAASQVLYSVTSGNGFRTGILDTKTGNATALNLRTLAEKCTWSNKNTFVYCAVPRTITDGRYPDDWYQGRVSFDDNIWQIDSLAGTTKLLIDPNTVGAHVDATNITLDPEEKYLLFTNKVDSKLWGLKI